MFRIALHLDDRKVLEHIKETLNCGRLNTERNTLVFSISRLSDIETILIPLFEQFSLNTIKHLDYLDFKKAFFLFKHRKDGVSNLQDVYSNIINLKNGMNDKRINFVLPEFHSIRITGNYFVGFLVFFKNLFLNQTSLILQTRGGRVVLFK